MPSQNYWKHLFIVLLAFPFLLTLSCSAVVEQGELSEQEKRQTSQTKRADRRYGNPTVDNSQLDRRIVLVDQTDRSTGKREGWLILCQSPKKRDFLEVKLMSAQRFIGGEKNGISVFFDGDGRRLLMAGIWKNNAPWEGDFFLEPPSGNKLILDGYFEDVGHFRAIKRAARFKEGVNQGLAGDKLRQYSDLFLKELRQAIVEINQLTRTARSRSEFPASEVTLEMRELHPAEKGAFVMSELDTNWQYDLKEPPRRLAVLEEFQKGTSVRHGWVLMQYLRPYHSSPALLMSAQHFKDGKLDGFSYFFNRKRDLESVGYWENGVPFFGDFPIRYQYQKSKRFLITDGFWGGTYARGNRALVEQPFFGQYSEGKYVGSAYKPNNKPNYLAQHAGGAETLELVYKLFENKTAKKEVRKQE